MGCRTVPLPVALIAGMPEARASEVSSSELWKKLDAMGLRYAATETCPVIAFRVGTGVGVLSVVIGISWKSYLL